VVRENKLVNPKHGRLWLCVTFALPAVRRLRPVARLYGSLYAKNRARQVDRWRGQVACLAALPLCRPPVAFLGRHGRERASETGCWWPPGSNVSLGPLRSSAWLLELAWLSPTDPPLAFTHDTHRPLADSRHHGSMTPGLIIALTPPLSSRYTSLPFERKMACRND
jgi:hypothetical protein